MSAAPVTEDPGDHVDLPCQRHVLRRCARAASRISLRPPKVWCARMSTSPRPQPRWNSIRRAPPCANLVDAIEELGYGVPAPVEGEDIEEQTRQREYAALRRRLWLAAAFAAPVVALGMWPGIDASAPR